MKRTHYEALHYVPFFMLLLLAPSYAQVFS